MNPLTPFHLKILLHIFITDEPLGSTVPEAPTATAYLNDLKRWGLLFERVTFDSGNDNQHGLTPKGRAHIEQMLHLELPREVTMWINATGKEIKLI